MRALPGTHATWAIARMSAKRCLRSRVLVIAAVLMSLSFLPTAFGAGESRSAEFRWEHFLRLAALLQMLVLALLAAPAIAEEIENKTYSYLWSRPIPRWSILAGKLLVAILIGTLLTGASAFIGFYLTGSSDTTLLIRAIAALFLGCIAASAVASCLGVLASKYAFAVSIAYFLVLDSIVGSMPFSLARLSVSHNVTAIAGYGPDRESIVASVLWLLGLTIFTGLISLSRLATKEFSTGS